MAKSSSRLVWFRRDLRVDDHAALYHALREGGPVWCAFVFDTEILDELLREGWRADRRVEFIHAAIVELDAALRDLGGGLIVRHGRARDLVPALARELGVDTVVCNRDYEPAAQQRDGEVGAELARHGIGFEQHKDQVIFERDEVLTLAHKPFSVFTPYKNAWLKKLTPYQLQAYPVRRYAAALATPPTTAMPSLSDMGFEPTNLAALKLPTGASGAETLFDEFLDRIDRYKQTRDFPATKGPSYLSVHLRFGTISVRRLAREAHARGGAGAEGWLNELIWRDFYFQILWHNPHVLNGSFRPEFDAVRWVDDEARFAAWCEGRTGYPLVDAGMRQLWATGWMHNRVRMVAASFLIKHLLIDWRVGETWFWDTLVDADYGSNATNWQWTSGTGVDSNMFVRIMAPLTQSDKFDAAGYIRQWVPELAGLSDSAIHDPEAAGKYVKGYPKKVIGHKEARERALAAHAKTKA